MPFTEAEIEFMTQELKQLVMPKFTLIAEIGDEPVGFTLCVPDINVALRDLNGRLTRLGFQLVWSNFCSTRTACERRA